MPTSERNLGQVVEEVTRQRGSDETGQAQHLLLEKGEGAASAFSS
jgi:hypothetical protein